MKKLSLSLTALVALASFSFAGTESYSGKEMKSTMAPAPCPQWYADQEFNVSLWGTYVFTENDYLDDTYIEADHGWGGGIDAKYFFMRYFGVGLEGWAIDTNRHLREDRFNPVTGTFFTGISDEDRVVGSVLGTLTLRYPIPCTRFAPYVFGGGGAMFGGGERSHVHFTNVGVTNHTTGTRTEAVGQFGGGLEVRITPHIGWLNDFSWNVIDGPENNFGMVRSGLNFAF